MDEFYQMDRRPQLDIGAKSGHFGTAVPNHLQIFSRRSASGLLRPQSPETPVADDLLQRHKDLN
jgi:hypothetical protein